MFPGRFRRRKSDSLGPRPASVSSLRARVHTHVDAQHEAGHLTQAASAEQINRRTDTARVSERPRPGGNAGQCKPKIPCPELPTLCHCVLVHLFAARLERQRQRKPRMSCCTAALLLHVALACPRRPPAVGWARSGLLVLLAVSGHYPHHGKCLVFGIDWCKRPTDC